MDERTVRGWINSDGTVGMRHESVVEVMKQTSMCTGSCLCWRHDVIGSYYDSRRAYNEEVDELNG